MRKCAFVAGATGAAATRLIEELLRQKWRVIGASRKAPADKTDGELTYLAADLLDAGGLKLAISPYRDITHLFFTARAAHEETGVEPVTENVAMLRKCTRRCGNHVIDPRACPHRRGDQVVRHAYR